jgi:hypothetical protein
MDWVRSIYFVRQKNGKFFNIGSPDEQTENFIRKIADLYWLLIIFFKLVIKEKLFFTAFEIREKNKKTNDPFEFIL